MQNQGLENFKGANAAPKISRGNRTFFQRVENEP